MKQEDPPTMADQPQDNQPPTPTSHDIESQIKSAINSRSSYFQDQADSLTFEKVRRLLENDLGLETHALDTHKRFVKQWLQTCIESATSDNLSKSQDEAGENVVSSTEEPQPVDDLQVNNEAEEADAGGVETMEDSPVMGLMTGPKKAKTKVNAEDTESKLVPNEITIKKAIWARASYLRENSENITLAGLRRLLEEDLAFEKHSLDPFKKFIGQEVDELLSTESEKKNPKKDSHRKVSSNSRKEETSATSGNESDDVEEEEVKVRKRSAAKRKPQKTESVKKRKKTEETEGARRKQGKVSKSPSDGSNEEEGRNVSDDDNSDSSAEKPKKKKEVPKPPSYGKQVERLKSVIKSCGLSISPAIYKKVKQAPENKRESWLVKELEEMLAKEGLSTNPSEKEIKDVKKRKERAKELEGIDLSNIVSSGRRRSTASFIPPPKPKIPDLSESESEESENDDDDDEDEDEDEEGDEEAENVEADEDQENGDNGSQSEASDKGNSDSD